MQDSIMAESDTIFVFKSEDRKTLKELLWPARAAYKQIYIALGFDPTELHPGSSQTSSIYELYMKVVEAIINKGATKQQLIDALKSPTVGHEQLALRLSLQKNESISVDEDGNLKIKSFCSLIIMATMPLVTTAGIQWLHILTEWVIQNMSFVSAY